MSPADRSGRSRKPSSGSRRPRSRPDLLRSQRLTAAHDLSSFNSGRPELDDWLKRSALNADASGTGRTWVWTTEKLTITAYYALAPHVVRRQDVPKKAGRGSPDIIPAILLARLALDATLHGQGLGAALLADAVLRASEGIRIVGGRVIVVDAIDEAAALFYEHHGFVRTPTDRERLVVKASDVEASFAAR
jgi:GNAT superfamily N-acetyltransferase